MTNLLQSLTEWAGALTGAQAFDFGFSAWALGALVHLPFTVRLIKQPRAASALTLYLSWTFLWPIFDALALCWVATWPIRRAIGWVRGRRQNGGPQFISGFAVMSDPDLTTGGLGWLATPATAQPQPSAGEIKHATNAQIQKERALVTINHMRKQLGADPLTQADLAKIAPSARQAARAFGQSADNPEKPVGERLETLERRLASLEAMAARNKAAAWNAAVNAANLQGGFGSPFLR